jgi:hypothetical protein
MTPRGSGVAQSVRRLGTGWRLGVRRFLFAIVQAGFGAHSTYYTMAKGAVFQEGKRQVRETDNSSQSSAEVKKGGAITTLHHSSSRRDV